MKIELTVEQEDAVVRSRLREQIEHISTLPANEREQFWPDWERMLNACKAVLELMQ